MLKDFKNLFYKSEKPLIAVRDLLYVIIKYNFMLQ